MASNVREGKAIAAAAERAGKVL
ncbi:MAG: hypothetical protein WCP55_25080, partial [Lentisphaerota bacterium]